MYTRATITRLGSRDLEVKHPYDWAPEPGGIKERGVLIVRGRFRMFISDAEAWDLAHVIANHLEEIRA